MFLEVEKNKETLFILKDLKGIDVSTIFLQIDCRSTSEFIKPTIEHLKNDSIQIKYPFTDLGFYDVHINFGIHPICTYVVKVKK